MLSAESKVDVTLGLWKNIGLTNTELSSSVRSLGSQNVGGCVSARGRKTHSMDLRKKKLRVKWTSVKVG